MKSAVPFLFSAAFALILAFPAHGQNSALQAQMDQGVAAFNAGDQTSGVKLFQSACDGGEAKGCYNLARELKLKV